MGLYIPGNLCKKISPFIFFSQPSLGAEPQGQATAKGKRRKEDLGGSGLCLQGVGTAPECEHPSPPLPRTATIP